MPFQLIIPRAHTQSEVVVVVVDRSFSSSSSSSPPPPSPSPNAWRKRQLEKLEQKFVVENQTNGDDSSSSTVISSASASASTTDTSKSTTVIDVRSDEELQPMWKEMESRVARRKPRTLRQTGGRTGRVNIRKTDEEVWLQQGLYDNDDGNDDDNKDTKHRK